MIKLKKFEAEKNCFSREVFHGVISQEIPGIYYKVEIFCGPERKLVFKKRYHREIT